MGSTPPEPRRAAPAAEPAPGETQRARKLLAGLRELMAAPGTAQSRLDAIVQLIAREMGSDVCSVYALRAGEVLELFASVGLNPDAIHRTRLRVGEGLVGTIASSGKPLAVARAAQAPGFAARPETGEDAYASLSGVPVLRGGKVSGVLVVQSRLDRALREIEIEMLETVAMAVAELFADGGLVSAEELAGGSDPAAHLARLEGFPINRGIAIGRAHLHRRRRPMRGTIAEDTEAERQRLAQAQAHMLRAIDRMLSRARHAGDRERLDILETYRMFAEDRGWLVRIDDAIGQGLTADAAVAKVQNDMRARMGHVSDPYLRDRLLDLEDLTGRLLDHLGGEVEPPEHKPPMSRIILVARALGPAELLDYEGRLDGVILEEGAATSHVAIVARAMGVPVLGRVRDATGRIEEGDRLVVDAERGQAFLRPGEDVIEAYRGTLAQRATRRATFAALRDLPAETRDGARIALSINAGLSVELAQLDAIGADGVGLYRTEIPFMVRASVPDVAAQRRLYAEALQLAGDRPLVFRTLDVGGDKRLPALPETHEPNPALGWRAIRMGLDRPALLRQQIRALLQAAAGRDLWLMVPLVGEVAEFRAARALLDREVARAQERSAQLPTALHMGVMIEVPALLWQLDALASEADFLSVGTNDLHQFLFAADRENPMLSARFDVLSPPMLRALAQIRSSAAAQERPVTVCGEMAGDPLEAMALIGLGYTSLSMAARSVGPVKAMIRSLDAGALRAFLAEAMRGAAHSLRPRLRAFARDRGVAIDPD